MAKEVLETLINKIIVEENPDGGHVLHIEGNLARTLNDLRKQHSIVGA